MAIPLVPKLLRAHLAELAENDERHNGRGRWEARDTELEIGVLPRAEGSARVRMGDTIVYAGVKLQIMVPYPDRPNQGGLMCSAEVRPVAGPNWEPGPPSPESIELGRVVDRGIRESGCIDVDNLCLIPGEKAWQVILDLFAISDDGNLFDAFALAGIAAMRTAMIPEERFEISGEDRPLNISKTPIMCSYHKVGGRFVYDADGREEREFTEIMEHAQSRCNELREMVSKVEEAG